MQRFPGQAALAANPDVESSGLSPEREQLVIAVLSRFIGTIRSRRPTTSHRLCVALAQSAVVALPGEDAPPAPEVPSGPWPTGVWALKALQLSQADICELFEEAEDHRGAEATLEGELVATFVPRRLWLLVDTLISDGPGRGSARADIALRRFARSEVPGRRDRKAGPPTRGSIASLRDTYRRLFRVIVELRSRAHPSEALTQWVSVPTLRTPRGGRQRLSRSAPRPELLREALRGFDQQVAQALSIDCADGEIERLRAMSDTAIGSCSAFNPLRNRAAFLLLLATGSRVSAVADLRRRDYVQGHAGVPPDYRGGAAIALRPGKSIPLDVVRFKVLPDGVARRVDAYLLYLERVVPVLNRRACYRRERPRRLERCPDDFPLLVSDRVRFQPFGPAGFRRLLGGTIPDVRGRSRLPVIRREGENEGVVSEDLRDHIGYKPHEFRRATSQLAERAGEIWNSEHAGGAAAQPEPGLYATALLDHRPSNNRLRELYGDRDTEAAYELLSGRAIEGIWRLLTGPEGSRKRPDLARIRKAAVELRCIEADLAVSHQKIASLLAGGPEPLPPKYAANVEHERDHGPRALHVATQSLQKQDYALEQQQRFEILFREVASLNQRVSLLGARRSELRELLQRLRYDKREWELIPDSAPAGAERIDLDIDAVIEGGEAQSKELSAQAGDLVRDWLTLPELAWAKGIENRSTVTRWVKGEGLTRRPERAPWRGESIPIDTSLGKNYRRVWIGGIREEFWASQLERDRVMDLRRRWPREQGWMENGEPGPRCRADLVLPEPFSSRRNEIADDINQFEMAS